MGMALILNICYIPIMFIIFQYESNNCESNSYESNDCRVPSIIANLITSHSSLEP